MAFRVVICMGCGNPFVNGLDQHLELCTFQVNLESRDTREHAIKLMKQAGYK